MHAPVIVLFLLALAFVPFVGAAPADSLQGTCGKARSVADAAGDVSGGPGAPAPVNLDAMDLRGLLVAPAADGVNISITFAKDPRQDRDWHFYIWFYFEGVTQGGGNNPTWTIQRSSTYQSITSMYFEDRYEYSVTWNGTTMTFTLPWEDMDSLLGNQATKDLGPAGVSASGPYPNVAQSVWLVPSATAQWNDWLREKPGEKGPLRCAHETELVTPAEASEPAKKAPGAGFLASLALFGGALAALRRRS